jgi:hypothetical protein
VKRDPFIETIISVECTSPTQDCVCTSTGVECGKSKDKPPDTELIPGSCKTTIVPST